MFILKLLLRVDSNRGPLCQRPPKGVQLFMQQLFSQKSLNSRKLNSHSVSPDWAIFCTLGNNSKPGARIILPKLPTLLGNFCKGAKMIYFSAEIIIGQLLQTFGDFYLVTLLTFERQPSLSYLGLSAIYTKRVFLRFYQAVRIKLQYKQND